MKSRFIGFYYPSYQYEVVKKSIYRKYDIVLHKYWLIKKNQTFQ